MIAPTKPLACLILLTPHDLRPCRWASKGTASLSSRGTRLSIARNAVFGDASCRGKVDDSVDVRILPRSCALIGSTASVSSRRTGGTVCVDRQALLRGEVNLFDLDRQLCWYHGTDRGFVAFRTSVHKVNCVLRRCCWSDIARLILCVKACETMRLVPASNHQFRVSKQSLLLIFDLF
jgi:hypothetical protein